ncbi:MAG: hypothetical protein KDJ65_17240 [Anaerolineae bacterium]|nr:hypothetical protein [Anaerolineae bacterium]
MSNVRSIKWITLLSVMLILTLGGAVVAFASTGENTSLVEADTQLLKFDVAEDMSRFVFDESVTFEEDGMPAYGSSFITQGYIYEYGTIDDTSGVLPNGEPEFPEKVIGEWTCRGFFVGDGAHSASGPMVITTQLYNFGDELGVKTLVTEGYELAEFDVAITRAITGGTGEYVGATGEAHQTLLGFNASEGVNLRYEIEVEADSTLTLAK